MIWLLLGAAMLTGMVWLMHAFARASVADIKTLLNWVAALGGISLALLLLLSGRLPLAIFASSLIFPLLWNRFLGRFFQMRGNAPPGDGPKRARDGGMTREEAYQVLGLQPGASEADIRAAHRRLMAAAHPDRGGSDWIAARLNQARDVLLRG